MSTTTGNTIGGGSGTTATSGQAQKENNKNSQNVQRDYKKKFVGGNTNLSRKIFDVTSRDAVHQFSELIKAIADCVGQDYTHGGDIRYMIENLTDYNFVHPENPEDKDVPFKMESWKKQ